MTPKRDIHGKLIVQEYQVVGMLVMMGADESAKVVEDLIEERDKYKNEARAAARQMEIIKKTITN